VVVACVDETVELVIRIEGRAEREEKGEVNNVWSAPSHSGCSEAQNGRMVIALIQDQMAWVLLLPLCPFDYGWVARDFIRDELYRRLGKNQ
jgi:hypothetical protein